MTDRVNLAEIRRRYEKAQPGPWRVVVLGDEHAEVTSPAVELKLHPRGTLALLAWGQNTKNDAEFIARAREDVPALVQEVERLELQHRNLAAAAVRADEQIASLQKALQQAETEKAALAHELSEVTSKLAEAWMDGKVQF